MVTERMFDALDVLGIGVQSFEENEYQIEFGSDAGEDFVFYIDAEDDHDFAAKFEDYAWNFDPDDHATMWIAARGSVEGVPESVRTLIEDAEMIRDTLEEAARALQNALEV